MSGPKTSQLEIGRRIQAQLAALRSDVDAARARARRTMAARCDELCAQAASCPDGGEIAAELHTLAASFLARLDEECSFAPCAAMDDSVALAARCAERAATLSEAFRSASVPAAERIDQASAQAAAREEAQDFAALLRAAAEEGGSSGSGTSKGNAIAAGDTAAPDVAIPHAAAPDTATTTSAGGVATNTTTDEDAEAVYARALALVHDPHVLPADRALLLDVARNLDSGTTAQLALLLPAMEANARTAADLAASIADAEAQLAAGGAQLPTQPAAFATLEEAAEHLEALRNAQAQADRDAYLQACIDEVMAAHGYAIARSVRMGRDLTGTHRLYGAAGATEGLHAFVSEEGDLMVQVAGLPDGPEAVADGEAIVLAPAASPTRAEALLESQRDFCAVYDEIAADLAAFGIVNRIRYRAEPDSAYSREAVPAAHADQEAVREAAGAETPMQATVAGGGAQAVPGEATVPRQRPVQRKRSQAKPHAREMR